MSTVRLGIIGIGNMGRAHAQSITDGKVPRVELAAVCDLDPVKMARFPKARAFTDHRALIASGVVDAVLVATPHYFHTTQGIDVLEAGLHLMVEKPISVHVADARRLIAAHRPERSVFAAMFNQRTDPFYQKLRQLIRSGELGAIRRVNWIITNWFRTEAYYASGGWRATWGGEGGGVLLNQCPHNLDLMWWLFGSPARVRGFCRLGRYHDIEVEDDVTAYLEYPDGGTGVFITSTGEAPGTNRLEITAERGRVVYENDKITYTRNEVPMGEFSRTTSESFGRPPTWDVTFPMSGSHGGQHNEILANFAAAILDRTPLIAPAAEGIHSVELACAMLQSSFLGRSIELPLDAEAYAAHLQALIEQSKATGRTKQVREAVVDLGSSFR